jgi:hypothetical protein
MKRCMLLLVPLCAALLCAARPVTAQERETARTPSATPTAMAPPPPAFPLGTALLRSQFAGSTDAYDLRLMGLYPRSEPAPDWNAPNFQPRPRTALETSLPPDYGSAQFPLLMPAMFTGEMSLGTQLLLMLGMSLANYGYQYLRETAKGAQPGGLDELHLPGAPGVYRTSDDVRSEALRRGEAQSIDLAIERREQERRKLGKEKKARKSE